MTMDGRGLVAEAEDEVVMNEVEGGVEVGAEVVGRQRSFSHIPSLRQDPLKD